MNFLIYSVCFVATVAMCIRFWNSDDPAAFDGWFIAYLLGGFGIWVLRYVTAGYNAAVWNR